MDRITTAAVPAWIRAAIVFAVLGATLWAVGCQGGDRAPRRILFLGDSITEEEYFVNDIEEALQREARGRPPRVIRRGKGGETLSGLTEASFPAERPWLFDRLNRELWRHRPDWVVVCYGLNCGLFQPYDEVRFAAYQAGMERLIRRVHKSGMRLVVLTPPPFARQGPEISEITNSADQAAFLADANDRAVQELSQNPEAYGYGHEYSYYNYVIEDYVRWLRTLDERDRVWVIDVWSGMMSQMKACYDEDSVHPNRFGHHLIAQTFLAEWPRIVEEAYGARD